MAAWAHTNATLLDAATDDVAHAIRQKHDLKGFPIGKHTGGTGISVNRKRAKQHTADMKRAEACARQLETEFQSDMECTYIPDSGIHRPLSRPKKSRTANAQKPVRKVLVAMKPSLLGKKSRGMALRTVRKRSIRLESASDKEEDIEPDDIVSDRVNPKRRQRQTAVNWQGDDKTFQVVFCTLAIKTCYGCHQPFRPKYRLKPTNVILKVMCHRPYMNKQGQRVTSWHRQAAYLHLKLKCMQNYSLHASVDDIIVHDDIYRKLSDDQIELLHKFGVSV